eukprot:scaffold301_cov243-Pinguiococcus_pyrenoidosus.AAC.165
MSCLGVRSPTCVTPNATASRSGPEANQVRLLRSSCPIQRFNNNSASAKERIKPNHQNGGKSEHARCRDIAGSRPTFGEARRHQCLRGLSKRLPHTRLRPGHRAGSLRRHGVEPRERFAAVHPTLGEDLLEQGAL